MVGFDGPEHLLVEFVLAELEQEALLELELERLDGVVVDERDLGGGVVVEAKQLVALAGMLGHLELVVVQGELLDLVVLGEQHVLEDVLALVDLGRVVRDLPVARQEGLVGALELHGRHQDRLPALVLLRRHAEGDGRLLLLPGVVRRELEGEDLADLELERVPQVDLGLDLAGLHRAEVLQVEPVLFGHLIKKELGPPGYRSRLPCTLSMDTTYILEGHNLIVARRMNYRNA